MRLAPSIAFTLLLTVSCTVTPKTVKDEQASLDGNTDNSGLIGYDSAGNGIITTHARDRYNQLMAVYGGRFDPVVHPGDGLTATSTNTWLIDGQHRFYFETANRWRKQEWPK